MNSAKTFTHGAVSIRSRGAVPESREAFIRRGLASRDNAKAYGKAHGEYVSKEALMNSLWSKLRSAKD